MRRLPLPVCLVVTFVCGVAATAAQRPIAVSPGGTERVVDLADPCPTFSWGSVVGASAYELVVYALAADGSPQSAPARQVLRVEVAGAASAWSPALAQCMDYEGRYAWSIRARRADGLTAWSEPRIFAVRANGALEQAVARILERYLAEPGALRAVAAAVSDRQRVAEAPAPTAEAREDSAKGYRSAVASALEAITDVGLSAEHSATSATATHGVRGVTHSSAEGSAGVAGASDASSGVSHGVWGEASSTDGYAGYFSHLNSTDVSAAGVLGGTGVYASAGRFSGPDVILGRNDCGSGGNDGRLWSDPICTTSDLFFESNSSVTVTLDRDQSSSGQIFRVVHGGVGTVFTVEDDGDLIATGGMTLQGNPVVTTTTDQDTLAGLGCAADQLALRNASNTAWECSSSAPPGSHDHLNEQWTGSGRTPGPGLKITATDPVCIPPSAVAIYGETTGTQGGIGCPFGYDWAGVKGKAALGTGVWGQADQGYGVYGLGNVAGGRFQNSDTGPAIVVHDPIASFSSGDLELETESNLNLVIDSASDSADELRVYAQSTAGSPIFKIEEDGDVFADGGYHCGNSFASSTNVETALAPCLEDSMPADFAEMLPAATAGLEPGDVLVIDDLGRLDRSSRPYQSSVAGAFSTRPSYLGNGRYADDEGFVPLAIVGIVPVKVTDEAGAIRPGDVLVSSSSAGHAMRGGDQAPNGTIIGKALEPLDGPRGVIQMLIIMQ
jgi:hypothetical protein